MPGVAYRGANIPTRKVFYTGRTINGTRADRTAVALTISVAAGVVATNRVPIGAVLIRDPFGWETGGSKIGVGVDATPLTTRTGNYESTDYTQPQASHLHQHKVVVIESGDAPANDPLGGRWVTVIDVADVAAVLLTGAVVALTQVGVSAGSFAVGTLPVTSVSELVAVFVNGIGQTYEANDSGELRLRSVKLCGIQNPSLN